MQDQIYQSQRKQAPFEFNEEVVKVFPDMISRSVPGYAALLLTIEQIAKRFGQDNSNAYDLGCSLGAATYRIQEGFSSKQNAKVIGVDNSGAMICQISSRTCQAKAQNDCDSHRNR